MELYGYEMHSIDEIKSLLNTDRDTISKIIGMMKNNMLGITSEDEDVLEYEAFDDRNVEAEAETDEGDEIVAIAPEDIIIPGNITDSESEEEPQSVSTEERPVEEASDIGVEESDDEEEGGEADGKGYEEEGPPAPAVGDEATGDRAEHRGEAEDRTHDALVLAALPGWDQVADDGLRQRH